jgi:SAM-dependent methyltransferase
MMQSEKSVQDHYGVEPLVARVDAALRAAGLDRAGLSWKDLTPLDQFHVRGLQASKELAEALKITPGSALIDIGSGLGGPARFLAATFGCQVTGIDLSVPFVEIANALARRVGMEGQVKFQQGNALALPFADQAFDYAWTQHVAMNIADRQTLYAGIHRVLKTGGKFAIYDIIAGDGRPLQFPVPWASAPNQSFLVNAESMRKTLREAGFGEVSWTDKTEQSLAWFSEMESKGAASMSASALGLHITMGERFAEAVTNLSQNFKQGRVRAVQAILEAI